MVRWHTIDVGFANVPDAADLVILTAGGDVLAGVPDAGQAAIVAADRVGFKGDAEAAFDVLPAGHGEARVLVLGAGDVAGMPEDLWLRLGCVLPEAMRRAGIVSLRAPKGLLAGQRHDLALGALLHAYRLDGLRKAETEAARRLIFTDGGTELEGARQVATAILTARAWVDTPANLLNPATFASEALALNRFGASTRVIDTDALEAMGAGAILAVGRGGEHRPQMAVVEWRGADRASWDAVLVGKGLTFDGGGLNLKTRPIIDKMKFDMAGGAAVLGAVALAASRRARVNVVAIVPMVENAIDSLAYRPGDVITSLSGLTIEVADTDAEGRMVLADALTFALREYAPTAIVDVATLTGALTAVLHEEFAGLFTADDALANALLRAGTEVSERLWRLPLDAAQAYLVDSAIADVRNLGVPGFLGLSAGSPTAGAQFLWRFAREACWAHIDIAGVAWATRSCILSAQGATGFGVRLLDRWLASFEEGS